MFSVITGDCGETHFTAGEPDKRSSGIDQRIIYREEIRVGLTTDFLRSFHPRAPASASQRFFVGGKEV